MLLFIATDLSISAPKFVKFFAGITMFPIYLIITNDYNDLLLIIKSYMIVALLFIVNFAVADMFSLGRTVYDESSDDFMSGNFVATILYIGSVIIIVAPVLYISSINKVKRIRFFIVIFILLILILLSMRRTAILSILIAYTVFALYYIKKRVVYKIVLRLLMLVFLTSPLYFSKIEKRFAIRADRFEEGFIEKEGRFVETALIWSNITSFKDKEYSLIGKELFNSAGNYGYSDQKRVIHADLNIILSGAGLIGLFLYLMFNMQIWINFLFLKKKISTKSSDYIIWVVSIGLLFASFAISFSSGLFSITYRTAVFSLLGSFYGYLFKNNLLDTN